MDEMRWTPAWQVRDSIVVGAVSAVEAVEASLRRLVAVEPELHAFRTICADEARAAAREADAMVDRGDLLGPLHGVPVVLKDEPWVAGVPATGGSLLFEDFVPEEDGTVAARLRAAGAIVIGMTNVPEFAPPTGLAPKRSIPGTQDAPPALRAWEPGPRWQRASRPWA